MYEADSAQRDKIIGMNPQKEKHETGIYIDSVRLIVTHIYFLLNIRFIFLFSVNRNTNPNL